MPNNTDWTPDGPEEHGLNDASLKQLRTMYQEMKQQGLTGNDKDARHLEGIMQQLEVELGKSKRPAPGDGVEITPDAGFVVKTVDKGGKKAFINVCSHDKMPLPSNWAGSELSQSTKDMLEKMAQDGHLGAAEEAARFPMAIGPLRDDRDHLDQAAWVVDVILHPTVLRHSNAFKPMKMFVVLVILGSVSSKHEVKLDKRYKLPKMRYKGPGPLPQTVRAERPALISEVDTAHQDPVFPLRSGKRKLGRTSASSTQQPAQTSRPAAAAGEMPAEIRAALGQNGSNGSSSGQEIHLDIQENGEVLGVRPPPTTAAPPPSAASSSGSQASQPASEAAQQQPAPQQSEVSAAKPAAAKPSANGHAATAATPQIAYDGRPAKTMTVSVPLAKAPGKADADSISVRFCNASRQLSVSQPGQEPVQLALPFMAYTQHSTASVQPTPASIREATVSRHIVVTLPIQPSLDALREARTAAGKGTIFDKIHLSNTSFMDLEP